MTLTTKCFRTEWRKGGCNSSPTLCRRSTRPKPVSRYAYHYITHILHSLMLPFHKGGAYRDHMANFDSIVESSCDICFLTLASSYEYRGSRARSSSWEYSALLNTSTTVVGPMDAPGAVKEGSVAPCASPLFASSLGIILDFCLNEAGLVLFWNSAGCRPQTTTTMVR